MQAKKKYDNNFIVVLSDIMVRLDATKILKQLPKSLRIYAFLYLNK